MFDRTLCMPCTDIYIKVQMYNKRDWAGEITISPNSTDIVSFLFSSSPTILDKNGKLKIQLVFFFVFHFAPRPISRDWWSIKQHDLFRCVKSDLLKAKFKKDHGPWIWMSQKMAKYCCCVWNVSKKKKEAIDIFLGEY